MNAAVLSEARALAVADVDSGRPNRLGVKGDLTRFTQSDAWCAAYDRAYRWRAYGPGRYEASA